jgi:uncharacterized membrane protein
LNVQTIARLERAAAEERTTTDRIVDGITEFCGSMSFVYFHIVWFGAWIVWNTQRTVPHHLHFDSFPFNLLTMTVSLEAILLSTFILISQNRQSRLADRRNHLDLQINLLSEQETTKMLSLLDQIAQKLGVNDKDDPEIGVLEEATRPDRLVQQIEEVIERRQQAEESGIA